MSEYINKLAQMKQPTLLQVLSFLICGGSTAKNKELTIKAPKIKIVEFANSIDPDEVAHHEPSHLDLPCLPFTVLIFV